MTLKCAVLLLVFAATASLARYTREIGGNALILVPHGEDPETSKDRVVVPHDGAPLPCVVAGIGIHEHGQTFLKNNFHYKCTNGTAEVIACVADDMSVIQINRTFLRNGIRHRCLIADDTVTYEQRSTCFENGVHYDVGESFRNGSFKLVCKDRGIQIDGCFLQNSSDVSISVGQTVIIGQYKHSCEVFAEGKIRYVIHSLACHKNGLMFNEGEVWTDRHIRYQCEENGAARVLGCVDDGGLFIELGRDILIQGIMHRCYRINNTSFYHRFPCEDKTLQECIAIAPSPRQVRSIIATED